jgi:hypothetical protein
MTAGQCEEQKHNDPSARLGGFLSTASVPPLVDVEDLVPPLSVLRFLLKAFIVFPLLRALRCRRQPDHIFRFTIVFRTSCSSVLVSPAF